MKLIPSRDVHFVGSRRDRKQATKSQRSYTNIPAGRTGGALSREGISTMQEGRMELYPGPEGISTMQEGRVELYPGPEGISTMQEGRMELYPGPEGISTMQGAAGAVETIRTWKLAMLGEEPVNIAGR
ncbi:hypothetical protein LSAT2_015769 [Lamellibrachia satsuma]|nr:hypothetical protein LSAT2_015769 [Lamellibrachia satsuma]